MDKPLYVLDIDENEEIIGVDAVGLVEQPAIDRAWMAFSKTKSTFEVVDDVKQILAGALMVADLPIYRRDEATGKEYYVTFPPKTIFKIVERLKKTNLKLKFNLDHNPNNEVQAFLMNDFIIDTKMGVGTPQGHKELPNGSWFGFVKIADRKQFDDIKSGKTGFSVEGYFNEIKIGDIEEEMIQNKIKQIQMKKDQSKLKGLFNSLASFFGEEEEVKVEEKVKMETATLEDGTLIEWDGTLDKGTIVKVVVEGEESVNAPDATHTLSTGVQITTENGIVTEIVTAETEEVFEVTETAIEEVKAEVEVLKEEIAELVAEVETFKKMFADQKELSKTLFESIKFLAEEEDVKKDKFNKAKEGEVAEKQLSRNAEILLKRITTNSKSKFKQN